MEKRLQMMLACALCSLALVGMFALVACGSSQEASSAANAGSKAGASSAVGADDVSEGENMLLEQVSDIEKELSPSIELSFEMMDEIPASDGLESFGIGGAETPSLTDAEQQEIMAAIQEVKQNGELSAVFVNTRTGRGIAYSPDSTAYTASTVKAVFSLFICETQIETGEQSLQSRVSGSSLESLMRNAIVDSDNDAYRALRYGYMMSDLDGWLNGMGITVDEFGRSRWYPECSARTMATLWCEMLDYLNGKTETANWLSGLLASTSTSFIRDGLKDTGAEVLNKAGWISEGGYDAVTDNAIVSIGGETYIMSLMSTMSDGDRTEAALSHVASALFAARGELD